MLLHFKIEVLTEDPLVPLDGLFRTGHVSGDDVSCHLTCDTCRAAYEILRVFLHNLVGNARLFVVFSFDMSSRNDLHQVLVAIIVLGQENQVKIASVVLVLYLVVIVLCHVDLTSDDRLHLRELFSNLEELLHTVHVSMVSNGQSRHA